MFSKKIPLKNSVFIFSTKKNVFYYDNHSVAMVIGLVIIGTKTESLTQSL